MIEIRHGRRAQSSNIVPGPGNRAGFNDGKSSYLPTAVVHDSRLGPSAAVIYWRLLAEGPPFDATWDELTTFVLGWDRRPDDTEEEMLKGLQQLRTHKYLLPSKDGWMLDVPDDAEAHAYDWSRQ